MNDPIALLRKAEQLDRQGAEAAAVLLYERAITLGLPLSELPGAMLGWGSTLRSLGNYEAAVRVLRQGSEKFPDDLSFAPFLAMALYNGKTVS